MPILLDFSQMCLSATYAFSDDVQVTSTDKEKGKNILRHIILSQVKSYKAKYGMDYGELIICCDGKNYWRRDIFPPYKACRKKARSESTIDWKLIFDTMDEVIDDLEENFPYKVIRLNDVECDDIIATLTKYYQTNETIDRGFYDEIKPILIVSSDRDFVQLHKYPTVEQIAPHTKAKIKTEDATAYLKEKIIRGDRGDGIPNILSEDEVFIKEDGKQNVLSKKKFEAFMASDIEHCEDPFVKKNWERNTKLISFECIPLNISERILEEYKKPIRGNMNKVFNYLLKHKCMLLLKDVNSF